MLKSLDRYIDDGSRPSGPLAYLQLSLRRDRRFAVLFTISFIAHVLFYALLIKLDSMAMMRIAAAGRRPALLVKVTELALPPERSTHRTVPEPLERADVNRLQFDPKSADDVHLIPRSPKPAERRGTTANLPAADQIERHLRASQGSGGKNRPGLPNPQLMPPMTSSIQANRIGQLDEAIVAQTPPTQAASIPPAPSPRQDPNPAGTGMPEVPSSGTRRGSNTESTALGLEAAQGQYMALVRAKIRKVNERIMPREWIKDVLRDKVSADFSLVIKRDGQILSSRLLRSSGYSVLDGYARQAIFTASPFEGYPQSAGTTIIFTVTVYFYTL